MLPGIPESAICVQRFDDSLILQFTILIAIRYVLHRCESQEIRCQKLYIKLIITRFTKWTFWRLRNTRYKGVVIQVRQPMGTPVFNWFALPEITEPAKFESNPQKEGCQNTVNGSQRGWYKHCRSFSTTDSIQFSNDPTAGSPTVTLLRLLLPLNDQVWPTSQHL